MFVKILQQWQDVGLSKSRDMTGRRRRTDKHLDWGIMLGEHGAARRWIGARSQHADDWARGGERHAGRKRGGHAGVDGG